MTARPEFSHRIDLRQVPVGALTLAPDAAQRRQLAARFGLRDLAAMRATIALVRDGATVIAKGRLTARITQACAVSGEDLEQAIDEPVQLRFVPRDDHPAAEQEITAADCDDIAYDEGGFDLGEALAQSLALAIDPFATGPGAAAARRAHGLDADARGGAFAALRELKFPD